MTEIKKDGCVLVTEHTFFRSVSRFALHKCRIQGYNIKTVQYEKSSERGKMEWIRMRSK